MVLGLVLPGNWLPDAGALRPVPPPGALRHQGAPWVARGTGECPRASSWVVAL